MHVVPEFGAIPGGGEAHWMFCERHARKNLGKEGLGLRLLRKLWPTVHNYHCAQKFLHAPYTWQIFN